MNTNNILITGASCFVGFHLASTLAKKKCNVFVTISKKLVTYDGIQKKRLDFLKKLKIKFNVINLVEKEKVNFLINKINPNFIFHLAADTRGIRQNKFSLKNSTINNIKFIENLYGSIKKKSDTKIIIGSTNAEYKNIEGRVNEKSSCDPSFSPYGSSKLSASLKAIEIAEQRKIKTLIIRMFNPIGPYDSEYKLLPQVINALKFKKTIDLSPCTHKRDFIYIDRLIEGLIKAMLFLKTTNKNHSIMNLCYGKPTEIKILINKISEILKEDGSVLKYNVHKLRNGEPFINYGDNSIALKELNWEPGNVFKDIYNWICNEK